ncbi:YfhO family protein [Lachnospiraceae bacterium HCP1S3_A8]
MKEKIKHLLKADLLTPETALLVSFLTPVVAYGIMFMVRGIFPFGDRMILGSDLKEQYAPFLAEFRDRMIYGKSLFFSWNLGLGMNFWSIIAYYLASPWNLLSVLVPQKYLVEFMTALIVLKTGLSSLSMTWYLRKHNHTHDFAVVYFGVFYGMSGYVMAYNWHLMWMDCIVLFPLILWGAELLVKEGQIRAYLFFLALSIWSNYYISIMTCLFLILYFPALLILHPQFSSKERLNRCKKFVAASLLAGGISAVLLIPEIFTIRNAYGGMLQVPEVFSLYFSPIQVLARHMANVRAEYELAHWPNIYCGTAVLFLIPLYLMCKGIDKRERVVYGGLAALLLISFCVPVLDYIWHGFHFPVCFPGRQSYIYIFLILCMGYQAYLHLGEISGKQIAVAFAMAGLVVTYEWVFPLEKYFQVRSYGMTVFYLLAYLFLMTYGKSWKRLEGHLRMLVFSLVTVEAAFTVTDNGMFENDRMEYIQRDVAAQEIIATLYPQNRVQEQPFFRMKLTPADRINMGAWFHYPAVEAFSSTNSYALMPVLKSLGYESSPSNYGSSGATPLADLLFDVAYDLDITGDKEQLRKLTDPLPVGFTTDSRLEEAFSYEGEDPADFQNHLANLYGLEKVLLDAGKIQIDDWKGQGTIAETGNYYIYVDDPYMKQLNYEIESHGMKTEKESETWVYGCLVDLGLLEAGTEISLETVDYEDYGTGEASARLYRFQDDNLTELRNKIQKHSWQVDQWTDTTMTGTIVCEEPERMIITIPYDEGWKVLVDGKQQKPEKALGALLGLDLEEGIHRIEIRYIPQGFWCGFGITILSFMGGIVLMKNEMSNIAIKKINKIDIRKKGRYNRKNEG